MSLALATRRQVESNSATSTERLGPFAVIWDCQAQVARRLVGGGQEEEEEQVEVEREEEEEEEEFDDDDDDDDDAFSSSPPPPPLFSSPNPCSSLSPYHTSASPGGAGTTCGCAVEADPKPSLSSKARDTPVVEGAEPGRTRPPRVAGAGRVSSVRGSSS